jgi:hypothetical protein
MRFRGRVLASSLGLAILSILSLVATVLADGAPVPYPK